MAFYRLSFDWRSFNDIITLCLFCNGLMAATGELAPPTVYLHEPVPNIHIKGVDGNTHSFVFSF